MISLQRGTEKFSALPKKARECVCIYIYIYIYICHSHNTKFFERIEYSGIQ